MKTTEDGEFRSPYPREPECPVESSVFEHFKHEHKWKPDPFIPLVDVCETCGEERA